MSIGLTSPFTGGAQTGFTSPTYDYVADKTPDGNGYQVAIDTIGGTQTGVDAHTVARPFTVSFYRPKNLQVLPALNTVTGQLPRVPRNIYRVITRKGVTPQSGQSSVTMLVETLIHVPAGSDTADAANVQAAIGAHIGALWDQSAGIGDMAQTGVLGA